MQRKLLDKLRQARAEGLPVALATRLGDGVQGLIFDHGSAGDLTLPPDRLAQVRTMLDEDRSGVLGEGEEEIFVRSYAPAAEIVVVGAVHISQYLLPMASMSGLAVRLIDPRRAFASPERFPGLEIVTAWPDEALAAQPPHRRSAVVTLTHDPKLDDPALEVALNSPAFYIGALGSRRTHAQRLERLTERGFGPEQLARIHGPAGLDLGSRSPAEIAVSVLAQIIAARHGKATR
ncbi:XdhC family protein [Telmatospirillum sp. J64-1]|uniref:XdhC family protein n=1 Tax=Telmatospirillum sp. J64-1 TaxID=2502183 RepID=UPI00115F3525|nr:XdhC family protein [Telmatospirillum sp. J64-1]